MPPVAGTWSMAQGSTYSACSLSSGGCTKTRARVCTGQECGGRDCRGSTTGIYKCNRVDCAEDPTTATTISTTTPIPITADNEITNKTTNFFGANTTNIAGGAAGVGVMLFIAVVLIVIYIKKRRATAEEPRVDLNPVYGDYADPDYVCEMRDTNEDYAAPDIYEEAGAQARDFNSLYGH
jgi:hypothetical protein